MTREPTPKATWLVIGGLALQLVLSLWQVINEPSPAPLPDDDTVIVEPEPEPAPLPLPATIAFVTDEQGRAIDAPAIIEAAKLPPARYLVHTDTALPIPVLVGGVNPPSPSPVNPPPGPGPTVKATAVVYVYEKDQGTPPPEVSAAIGRINRELKILATAFEDDNKNGLGSVPSQYRVAVEAARRDGTPLLVVQAGETIIQRVSDPKTADEVWRAVAP